MTFLVLGVLRAKEKEVLVRRVNRSGMKSSDIPRSRVFSPPFALQSKLLPLSFQLEDIEKIVKKRKIDSFNIVEIIFCHVLRKFTPGNSQT